MDRETKTIITPHSKVKIELYTYVTGREKRALKNVFLSKMSLGTATKVEPESNPATLSDEAENKAIEMIVVSVAGKTDKLLDEILDMKGKDYDFIINEINKVSTEKDFLE